MTRNITNDKLTVISQNLLSDVSTESVLGFDERISSLFQAIFYSLSHDLEEVEVDSGGIIVHFLKNWKATVGVSSVSKQFPAILTGSVVEGACLSRLFHPTLEKSLELEADIMYVMGCINETAAESCLHELEKPGFLKVKSTEDISLFTSTVSLLEEISQIDPKDNQSYLNGKKLKMLHQNLERSQKRVQIVGSIPYIVAIEQKISGPSSEILFDSTKISDPDHIKSIVQFLHDLSTKMENLVNDLQADVESMHELSLIMISILDALKMVEMKRVVEYNVELSIDEVQYMKSLVSEKLHMFLNAVTAFQERYYSIGDFLQSVALLCNENKNDYFYERFDSFMKQSYDSPGSRATSIESSIRDSGFHNKDLIGELWGMQNKVELSSFGNLVKDLKSLSVKVKGLKEILEKQASKITQEHSNLNEERNIISFDNVSCFQCSFWPAVASGWTLRKRQWPSEQKIEEIIKAGCYIVAKQSQEGVAHSLEWRWSFSSAEVAIASLRTPVMKYCYFVFKSLFYRHLKVLNLPSYIAKTCMLHVSEQHAESWWQSFQNVSWYLLELFRYLQQCLEKSCLSHFFISKLNLFADVPQEVLLNALDIVSEILARPEHFFRLGEEKGNKIKELHRELHLLDNSSNIIKGSMQFNSFKERFKYATNLFQDVVNEFADRMRYSWLHELYTLLYLQAMHTNVSSLQREKLVEEGADGGTGIKQIQSYYEMNLEELENSAKEIKILRKVVKSNLKEMANLLGRCCVRCEICCQNVQCQTYRYSCVRSECKYDCCVACFNEIILVNHGHPLTFINQCHPTCFTQITHERLGKTDWNSALKECQLILDNVYHQQAGLHLGFSSKDLCSAFLDQGTLMKEEVTKLNKSLDLESGLLDNSNLFSEYYNNHFAFKDLKNEKKVENSYKSKVETVRHLLWILEKKNIILKLIYG